MTLPTDVRAERNRRIRSLAEQKWSHAQIGAAVGLSDEGVRKILASNPSPDERIHDEIIGVLRELQHLTPLIPRLQARVHVLRRQLARLEEEREARRIDRLLGLD